MSDLISRKRIEFELCESNMPKKYRDFCRRVINSESLSPTIDAELVRHGHWEIDETDGSYTCECGLTMWNNDLIDGNANYCPNCGAKMDGSSNEE